MTTATGSNGPQEHDAGDPAGSRGRSGHPNGTNGSEVRTRLPRPEPLRPEDIVRNPLAGYRETVESIVVAFTLALLFRAFEAEAFVIPTGSMAPTLMGRHKDLECNECGRQFQAGASAEEDNQSQSLRTELSRLERELAELVKTVADESASPQQRAAARQRCEILEDPQGPIAQLRTRLARKMTAAARCPNCGHVMRLIEGEGPELRYDPRYPSFTGDRIIVDKFSYDMREPARWDVVVFKFPEEAKTNYIKRLVGLPGETVLIAGGDIWTSRQGSPPEIARKPPHVMKALLQCVHDSDHPAPRLEQIGWPAAWSDWGGDAALGRWQSGDSGRSFTVRCGPGEEAMLRYRHFLPAAEDWKAIEAGRVPAIPEEPGLIDDFQPYNAIRTRSHWVGDLAVECLIESESADGELVLDLVEAGDRHRCRIDLATGDAILEAAAGVVGRGSTGIRVGRRHRVLFANVDDELFLLVDGRPVVMDRAVRWQEAVQAAARRQPTDGPAFPGATDPSDRAPVGISLSGVRQAASLTLSQLRVLRDGYYIGAVDAGARGELLERSLLEFPLEEDQFFVLGDNSAASKDSRLWVEGHHVDRRLLIGRALAIFWPHAVPAEWSIPVTVAGRELRLPCWPNFARMRLIR
jgi:signal peptidase I